MDETKIKNILLEAIVPPVIFALSIPVFLINIDLAHYFWLIIIPSKIFIRKRYPYK
jgi:hypothetical protein